MKKNYNFTRRKLYLPEYGRHIHQMVDSLLEIEDRQERTRQAKAVIAVMGNLNPTLRDTEDFKHKLWDHLFIMSDFQLDVDSPYAQPSRQDLMVAPQKLKYPQSRILFKHYGKYIQQFVRAAAAERKSPQSKAKMVEIARYMRSKNFEYNNEQHNTEAIIRDMSIMVGGEVDIDLSDINTIRNEYHRVAQPQRKQQRKQQPQRNNNGRKQNKGQHKVQQRQHNAHK